jgi:hypothetical protein
MSYIFLVLAVSLCSHPCSRVNRGTFTDGTNESVLNDHLPYVTTFHCSLGKSHKTGLIVCLTEFFIHLEMIASRQWLRPVFLKCMFAHKAGDRLIQVYLI